MIAQTRIGCRFLLALVAGSLLHGSTVRAQEKSADPELVAAWKALLDRIQTADVTVRREAYKSEDRDPPPLADTQILHVIRTTRFGWLFDHRLRVENEKGEIATRLLINPDYTSTIAPRLDRPEKPDGWVLRSVGEEKVGLADSSWNTLPWLNYVTNGNLVDWLNQPTVSRISVETIAGGTRRTYKNEAKQLRSSLDAVTTVRLDISDQPSRHVLAAEFVTTTPKVTTDWVIKFVYAGTDTNGIPVIKQMDGRIVNSVAAPGVTRYRYMRVLSQIDANYNGREQNHLFYLSHYGLPEPPGVTPPSRPTPNYVWLLIVAGGFGVLALGCRWLLKRRAKATLPPPIPPTA